MKQLIAVVSGLSLLLSSGCAMLPSSTSSSFNEVPMTDELSVEKNDNVVTEMEADQHEQQQEGAANGTKKAGGMTLTHILLVPVSLLCLYLLILLI